MNAQILNTLFKMKRMLKYHSRALGLGYECKLEIMAYTEAFEAKEDDGKIYSYPETLEIRIENHSSHNYSLRVSDGAWIAEGKKLNGKGMTAPQVYKAMLKELKTHAAQIAESKKAQPSKIVWLR